MTPGPGSGRRRDAVLLLAGVLLVGLAGLLGALLEGPGERVRLHWSAAELAPDDSVRITEVIDYDFAGEDRHGIHRRLPVTGAGRPRDVTATLDGAPVTFGTVAGGAAVRVRIGDPEETLTGVHRYRLTYTVPGMVAGGAGLTWDVTGLGWEVPVERLQARVTAPAVLEAAGCEPHGSGAPAPCAVRQASPGTLAVDLSGLDAGEGVTVRAEVGGALPGGAAPPPVEPDVPLAAEGSGGARRAGAVAAASAAVAALLVAAVVLSAGRDRAGVPGGGSRRAVPLRPAAVVKPSPVPPEGLTPAQAGILLAGRVRDEHRVAWLMSASQDGTLTISGRRRPVLRRGARRPDGPGRAADAFAAEVLDVLFARPGRIRLDRYHRDFAAAWKLLRTRLEEWRAAGGDGLWTPRGAVLHRAALWVGGAAALAGVALTAVADARAGWACTAGAGLALVVLARHLRARTPRGSRLRLATEAYRRHLADPATPRTDRATPWAVALGLAGSWAEGSRRRDGDLVTLTRHLPAATAAASSRFASSAGSGGSSSGGHGGDGGGGGGGDGGGGGGGDGGGSW
ncbi:DUF2207 domain-containing protein [Streptomyces chilikensis]|uniref:DUF2207 domain-containing protein n=1 Tax=Streptomyces chilikensis TaxID=1194079 RepID=UPI00140AC875|nr:DUF2207 domain-containing protein [Streptomyces chilikensis]